jgi:hypothetical protein
LRLLFVIMDENPQPRIRTGMPKLERSRICEVPFDLVRPRSLHTVVLLMPSDANRFQLVLMPQKCCAVVATRRETRARRLHVIVREAPR